MPPSSQWMETRTNAEMRKQVDRRDFCCGIFGNTAPCFSYLTSSRQVIFKYNGLQMSGVIKGETVNANELF